MDGCSEIDELIEFIDELEQELADVDYGVQAVILAKERDTLKAELEQLGSDLFNLGKELKKAIEDSGILCNESAKLRKSNQEFITEINALKEEIGIYSENFNIKCIENSDLKVELERVTKELEVFNTDNHPEYKVKPKCVHENDKELLILLTDSRERLRAENNVLLNHLELALLFCPKGPVPKGLGPMFYHTLNYKYDAELQQRIDYAREALAKADSIKEQK